MGWLAGMNNKWVGLVLFMGSLANKDHSSDNGEICQNKGLKENNGCEATWGRFGWKLFS